MPAKKRKRQQQVDEDGELTHDQIWDDSALIDSWNEAVEEYKVSLASGFDLAESLWLTEKQQLIEDGLVLPQSPCTRRECRRRARPS